MKTALILALSLSTTTSLAEATLSAHHQHEHHADMAPNAAPAMRQPVSFPDALKEETLSNMRDHLLAIQEITAYLAEKKFDAAAEVAETRLGMSSMQLHGAHEVAKYMPEGMQQVGHGMHQAASRFAVVAQEAGASGDVASAMHALSEMQGSCVACHAAYQLK